MRTILRTFTRQIMAGLRPGRQGVVGTVEVRGDNRLRMCDFYQRAITASARFLAAIERSQPALALAPTGHAHQRLAGHASSGNTARAPRCWQSKTACQRPSARKS